MRMRTDWGSGRNRSTPSASRRASSGGNPPSRGRRCRSICGTATSIPHEDGMPMPYDPEQEPYVALRTKALESLLIEKGLLTAEAVDERISKYERDIGPLNGARVVARAWVDPAFKGRLLGDATAAIGELGLPTNLPLVVVENTPAEHNM